MPVISKLILPNNTEYDIKDASARSGLAEKTDKSSTAGVAYGTCVTEAATAEKAISISGKTGWVLEAGAQVVIKFTYTNTASNPTLNVNSTGAKSVWYNTGLITTSNLEFAGKAGRPMVFVYDGTQFIFAGWSYDALVPSVSSDDNGKVLRVVSGIWTAVELPSANGVSF